MIYLRDFENEERVRGLKRAIELEQLQSAMSLRSSKRFAFTTSGKQIRPRNGGRCDEKEID